MSTDNYSDYYSDELNKIPEPGIFAHKVKITAGQGTTETKWMSLNEDSARILIMWLAKNYIPERHLELFNLNK